MQYESPSLVQMTYDLKNIINNGRTTKDFNISDDQIKFWITSKREKYLRQKLSKGGNINEYVQSLGCVPVSFVDRAECCDIDIGCKFLRTDQPLPYFIGEPTRIGPVDSIQKSWQLVSYERIPLEMYAPKYAKKFVKGFFKDFDGYLYLYYDPVGFPEGKFLTTINVQGALVDPGMAGNFNNCGTGAPCYSDSSPYPISLSLWNDIKMDIIKNELRMTEVTTEDETNNSKSDKEVNDLRKMK